MWQDFVGIYNQQFQAIVLSMVIDLHGFCLFDAGKKVKKGYPKMVL